MLVPAIFLLLFPADKLLPGRVELRSFDCLSGLRDYHRRRSWWWQAGLCLDPFRGFAGAWLLIRALRIAEFSWPAMPKAEYAVLLGVLALAALSQTFTRRDHGVLFAPIGFVGGTVIAVVPGFTPFFGVALALIAMFGFRQFYAFFAVGLCALPMLGFLFGASPPLLGAALVVFFLPLLAGMLTNSALEVPWVYANRP